MTPGDFIRKWADSTLRERQGSQEHFIDVCRLLGQPTPAEDDPKGERYCFERGAAITGGGDGWADVWRRGCFGWEYKGKHKDLKAALRQLVTYSLDLESPPYLVVSDMERIEIHSNWTNTVTRSWEIKLDDLRIGANLDILRAVFEGSEKLKPQQTPQELTAKVAARFGALGRKLQERGEAPRAVAHFLNRLVFCMFAEDARLLPEGLFTRLVKATLKKPAQAQAQLSELFAKMAVRDSFFGADHIRWFNGGLFDDNTALFLDEADLKLVFETADEHDWSQIDPAVFGTLFEQALKATRERPALGAHYTDREKILKIVEPVIVRPLMKEWDAAFVEIKSHVTEMADAEAKRRAVLMEGAEALKQKGADAKVGEERRRKEVSAQLKRKDAALGGATDVLEKYLARLAAYRVLDPACGSGNFLYVALHALKDLELRALVDAERLGIQGPAPRVGLETVKGIEIEPYAAELARVTLWIGDLQWMMKSGYVAYAEPVLSTLDQIECRDALLDPDGSEAEWPKVDAIIGNPPFLGDKRMIGSLGESYVAKLRTRFASRVPGSADFVMYWLEKSRAQIISYDAYYAGLVATQSIRRGGSGEVLSTISSSLQIFDAWDDEEWTVEGAAVRVALVCFARKAKRELRLDGIAVDRISSDLSGSIEVGSASKMVSNGSAFIGVQKSGPFEIDGTKARSWLRLPCNPNGRPNSDVLRPLANGYDIARRSSDTWIIDFGTQMPELDAALYEVPFSHIQIHVKPLRANLRRDNHRIHWWIHGEARPGMRRALEQFERFIVTPRVAKHRFFVWLSKSTIPDSRLAVFPRSDDETFGLLTSRFHELWSLRLGGWHGVGNDPQYTPSLGYDTFPFPEGLTPNVPAHQYTDDPRAKAIAEAAAELNRLREAWLNPPDLVMIEPEIVPTAAPGEAPVRYPDRVLPRDEAAAKELKKRTLTNLYNQRPQWLANAHAKLDAAVAAAYGWPADLSDEQVLDYLFKLNQVRSAAGR